MSGWNAGIFFTAEISQSMCNVLTKANFIQFIFEEEKEDNSNYNWNECESNALKKWCFFVQHQLVLYEYETDTHIQFEAAGNWDTQHNDATGKENKRCTKRAIMKQCSKTNLLWLEHFVVRLMSIALAMAKWWFLAFSNNFINAVFYSRQFR